MQIRRGDGRITYSNLATDPQGASKVECFEFPASVSAPPAAPGPADAERLAADAEERRALEQQLADEEERLDEAQRALSEQEANLGADDAPYYYALGPFVDRSELTDASAMTSGTSSWSMGGIEGR